MSISRLIGATAVLLVVTMPATAQQVISEPGYCAQFYPNANCQNKGPNNPYTGSYQRGLVQNNGMWSGDQTVGVTGKRPRAHRSDSSGTRMQ